MMTPTVPSGTLVELVEVDMLALLVTGKDVVDGAVFAHIEKQRAVVEELLEILCLQTDGGHEQDKE